MKTLRAGLWFTVQTVGWFAGLGLLVFAALWPFQPEIEKTRWRAELGDQNAIAGMMFYELRQNHTEAANVWHERIRGLTTEDVMKMDLGMQRVYFNMREILNFSTTLPK